VARGRWAALGGFSFTAKQKRTRASSPVRGHTLMQASQAWCIRAVAKPNNAALFRHAAVNDTSQSNAAGIRRNIRYLFLRMLGLEATDDDVETLYRDVFRYYEGQEDLRTAWASVCSALIRHPLWITY
jgi:hypothetical protein